MQHHLDRYRGHAQVTVHPQPLVHDAELCAVSRYQTAAHAGCICETVVQQPSAGHSSNNSIRYHGKSDACSGMLSDGVLTMVSVGQAKADQNTYD